MQTPQPGHVFLRIKRFGNQWATCGIGIIPPFEHAHDPRMKKLCTKLVPGQVVELPESHPLVKKRSKLVEIVDGPEKDEFIRPWVFHSAEEAVRSNPSKSRLGPQQILDGLTMREGAIENAPKHRKKAREALEKETGFGDGTPSGPDPEYEDDDAPLESPAQLAKRAQNRAPRDEGHTMGGERGEVNDDDLDGPAPPRRRARRSR